MSYKINLDDTLSKAEAIYLQIKNSRYQSDIVQTILGIEPTTPPPPPPPPLPETSKKMKSVVRPIKPPGFAVPVNREDTSEITSNSSENNDEYVDLEQHYRLQFDLFS